MKLFNPGKTGGLKKEIELVITVALVACTQSIIAASDTCITLQTGVSRVTGSDISGYYTSTNYDYTNYSEIYCGHWTNGGNPTEDRGLIKFDLSQIPVGAVIASATISFYADTSAFDGMAGEPTYGSDNASYLHLITSWWNPASVTFLTRPSSSSTDTVLLAQSTSTDENYLNIDISSFVQMWVDSPNLNYGMMLEMIGSTAYNSMIFYSPCFPDSTKWPKLSICYSIPYEKCVTYQGKGTQAIGSDISGYDTTENFDYTHYPEIYSGHWTNGGNPTEDRGLIRFDLSQIPIGAVIISAAISFYADTDAFDGVAGEPTYGSDNSSYIHLITSSWNPATVTFLTQPSISSMDTILLPQSTNTNEDYLNVDISSFVQLWVDSPNLNYGMMLKMKDSTVYNSMIFCSAAYPNSTKWPKLDVCYSTISSNKDIPPASIKVFPNPTSSVINIQVTGGYPALTEVKLFNMFGQQVITEKAGQGNLLSIPADGLAKGLYVVKVADKAGGNYLAKVVVQ